MTARKRVFLRGANAADFECPDCGHTTTVRLEEPVRSSTPVRVRLRCTCGRGHAVFLERRASGRKRVEIAGRFSVDGDGDRLDMVVRDLSRTGILFDPAEEAPALAVGDIVVVEFELASARPLKVVKQARVRRLDDGSVGAEYRGVADGTVRDPEYDLALAFHPGRGAGPEQFARG